MIPSWAVAAFVAIWNATSVFGHWLAGVFWGPRFWKIASEFFLEASVLIAVFPVLEVWIQRGGVSVRWALGSEGAAILLVVFAAMLASLASVDHDEG